MTFIDVSVQNKDAFLSGLERQDFELSAGAKRLQYMRVKQIETSTSKLSIAVLLDCSSSTQGEPFHQELDAASQFCDSMTKSASLRVWRFADDATPETPWTTDSTAILHAIRKLNSHGSTAMYAAIEAACNDLSHQQGEKAIVMFTDGRNSNGNGRLPEILNTAREHSIRIFTIALKSKDIDESALIRLSQETRGAFSLITEPEKIRQSFDSIARLIRRPVYRIVVLDPFDTAADLVLRIGDSAPKSFSLQRE